MKIKSDCSNEELNAAVAEHVAGYSGRFLCGYFKAGPHNLIRFKDSGNGGIGDYGRYFRDDGTRLYCGKPHAVIAPPLFATDANAMIKLLGQDWMVNSDRKGFVGVNYLGAKDKSHYAQSTTFCRAACFALLKSVGVEVVS